MDENNSDKTQQALHWLLDKEARDGRSLFLTDWTTAVQPELDNAHKFVEHSVTYGSTALQAAYIINGGALAALPALMTSLTKAAASSIATSAIPFVVGIAAAAVSSLCAYLNFQFHAQLAWCRSQANANGIRRIYGYQEDAIEDKSKKWTGLILLTLYFGVAAAIASLAAFVAGAWRFIDLVEATPK
jgi:hypothetical protein